MSENVQISKKKITIQLKPNDKRNVVASWDFSYTGSDKKNKIEKFEYKWVYKTSATSKWFDGSNGSVDYPARAVEYSTPENATLIAFAVKPVSKTHKENDKDATYFTASWSGWVKFDDFVFSATPPTNQVKSKTFKLNTYLQGDSNDSRPYVTAEWLLNGLTKFDFIKNFEYKWEYYDTSTGAYIDAPDGSGTTPNLTKAQRDNAKNAVPVTITTPKYFLATGQEGDKPVALYSKIRFTVTPVATDGNDGAFKAVAFSDTATLKFKTLTVLAKKIQITASKTTNEFTAFWKNAPKNIEHIESYDVEWQYDGDEKNYFNNISRAAATDIWEPGGTGNVSKSEHFTVKTADGDDDTIGCKYTFTPPTTTTTTPGGDTITIYPEVRFRVKPKCDDTHSFLEDWSDWKYYSFTVPTKSVTNLSLTASDPLTPRHVFAVWGCTDIENVASFAYEWRYVKVPGQYWSSYNSGTVDVTQSQSADHPYWSVDFDIPSDASMVEFKVKPVARVETAFSGQYETATYGVTTKVLTVDNVAIHIYDASNRTVYATWDHLDSTKVLGSGINWADLGIPGQPSDYPAESLDSLIRSKLLTNYEVVWRYYYLDTWFDTSGSSTTTSNVSGTYTVPTEASDISVSVKPVSAKEDLFVGAFSAPVVEPMQPKSFTFDKNNPLSNQMTVGWYEGDESTVAARFSNLEAIPSVNGSKVDVIFEWSTRRYGGWESATTDPISYTSSVDFLLSTFQVPTGAEEVRVRIKPVIDTLEYFGEYSDFFNPPFNAVIPDRSVRNVEVKIQRGTKRTCVATWEDQEELDSELVDSYDVEWQYSIDDIWYSPTSSSETPRARVSTYDAPDNAEKVRVRIKPVPKQAQYFIGKWCDDIEFDTPEDITPEVPSVPTIEVIDGYTFKAFVDTYDDKTSSIKFEVVDEEKLWTTAEVIVNLNRAEFQFTVAAGHKYRVRAAGVNIKDETGDWSNYSNDQASYPPPLETTPVVSATSATGAIISWDAPTTGTVTKYKIEYTEKLSYFDAAPEKVQNAERENVTQAELPEIGSGQWFFRVCTINDVGQSDWSEVVSIALGSTPTAPTTWSSRTTAKIGDDVYLYWTHNCADESAETSAILELTINGITEELDPITPPVDGSTSYYLLSGADITQESVIEWRVKTAGVLTENNQPVYGDWSTQRIVKIFSPPSILMTLGIQNDWTWDTFNFNTDNIYDATGSLLPLADDTVTTFPVLVQLNAYPATQTPVSYLVSVVSNNSYTEIDETGMTRKVNIGQEIYKKYYNTQKKTFVTMLLPDNIDLENGMSYTITATVAMNSGLSAEISRTFAVSWTDEDYILSAEISLDRESLVTYIRPFAMDEYGSYPTNLTLSVFRRQFDGGHVEIGSKLSNATRPVVVDPHPALDYARYRIVARSNATGAISYTDLPAYPIGEPGIVLQWDEEWTSYTESNPDPFTERPWTGSMIKLPYNVKVGDSNNVDLEVVEYIGRRHPVSYYGTQVGQKANWSSDIPKSDKETIYALRRLAVYLGNVYVRESNGAGFWAHVEVSFSIDYDSMVVPVSLDITRVEGGM